PAVLSFLDQAGTGAAAEAELVPHAGCLPRLLEEIALTGKDNRRGAGAIARSQEIVDRPPRSSHSRHGLERPVAADVLPGYAAAAVNPGRRAARDLDQGRAAGPVPLVIEVGTQLPDLAQLSEEGGEFAGHVVPADLTCGVEDSGRLVVGVTGSEIGEQPGAEPLGFADVQHAAGGVHHLIDAGPVLRDCAHPREQLSEIGGGEGNQTLMFRATHDWQW